MKLIHQLKPTSLALPDTLKTGFVVTRPNLLLLKKKILEKANNVAVHREKAQASRI